MPVRNAEVLANALQDLIENSKKRESMGREGRKLAEKEYSIENIVQSHIKVYFDLNSNNRKT